MIVALRSDLIYDQRQATHTQRLLTTQPTVYVTIDGSAWAHHMMVAVQCLMPLHCHHPMVPMRDRVGMCVCVCVCVCQSAIQNNAF